jgi:hypothetical protein
MSTRGLNSTEYERMLKMKLSFRDFVPRKLEEENEIKKKEKRIARIRDPDKQEEELEHLEMMKSNCEYKFWGVSEEDLI